MKEIFVTSPDTIAQLIIKLHLTRGMRREKTHSLKGCFADNGDAKSHPWQVTQEEFVASAINHHGFTGYLRDYEIIIGGRNGPPNSDSYNFEGDYLIG